MEANNLISKVENEKVAESSILSDVKKSFEMCKSVTVKMDDEGDILLSIRRNGGQNNASMPQVRYLEGLENYVGSLSHSKLLKIHKRVMSTIIDTLKENPNTYFYISI